MGGINFEYKYFTDQFIKWILSAATFVEKSSSRLENTLANLPVRVRVIISLSPANPITQSCCIGLQRALKHGIKAIQLRSKINKYFTQMYEDLQTLPSKAGADLKDLLGERHAHAINILQDCHDQLSRWFEQVKEASVEIERKQREEGEGGKYEGLNQIQNKFESLLLDDDEDEEEEEQQKVGEGEGVAEMDDVDEGLGEVRVKVICFGMDVVTCLEYVNEIWLTQLKQMQSIYGIDSKSKAINENKVDKEDKDGIGEDEEVSIITALAVTTVAFRRMDALFGKLSSLAGGLENATDFLPGIFQTILNEAAIGRCPLATFFNEALEHVRSFKRF